MALSTASSLSSFSSESMSSETVLLQSGPKIATVSFKTVPGICPFGDLPAIRPKPKTHDYMIS